jgi:hypothetical protein
MYVGGYFEYIGHNHNILSRPFAPKSDDKVRHEENGSHIVLIMDPTSANDAVILRQIYSLFQYWSNRKTCAGTT